MQLTGNGSDNLGNFAVLMPGHCGVCNEDTDVVLRYHSTQAIAALKKLIGKDPKEVPSLIITVNKKIAQIGVTCGCYAKFHRQVAHISRGRESRASRR